jgi:hypothetical protein
MSQTQIRQNEAIQGSLITSSPMAVHFGSILVHCSVLSTTPEVIYNAPHSRHGHLPEDRSRESSAWKLRLETIAQRARFEREREAYTQAECKEATILRQTYGEILSQKKTSEALQKEYDEACRAIKDAKKSRDKSEAQHQKAESSLLDALLEIQLVGHNKLCEASIGSADCHQCVAAEAEDMANATTTMNDQRSALTTEVIGRASEPSEIRDCQVEPIDAPSPKPVKVI